MIVACTVSYNSSVIIEKTIDALLSQSYLVDRIIIVDSNSKDSEKKRLASYQDKSEKIDFIWLNENVGGAGGFYHGLKYAKEKYDPDWYWLMDDDAFPDKTCLENLLQVASKTNKVGFIAPVIWGIDNNRHQLYHARIKKGSVYKFSPIATNIDELKDVESIDVDAFVGPLISKEAIHTCGLPRPGYFIEGDDTDFTLRISRIFPCFLIKQAQINHKDLSAPSGINPGGWWKQYYWFRNSILIIRNNIGGYEKYLGILSFLAFGLKQIFMMYLDKRYSGYKLFRSKILVKGLIDGMRGMDGKRIDPVEYKHHLEQYQKKRNLK